MTQNLNLKTEKLDKLLWHYSIPAIIGMLVSALYNVVDRVFIGNMKDVGDLAITGIGITMPIVTILIAFGMLIGIGAISNISIKLGEGKKDKAETILGNVIFLSIIVGGILTIVGLIFSNEILNAFGASKDTLKYAKEYVEIILYGSIFNIMGYALSGAIRADGNPRISSSIMVISCLCNVILDPILIYGFDLGIKGAAYATIFSQFVTLILSIIYYQSKRSLLKLHAGSIRPDLDSIKMIFYVGISPFAMQLATSLVQVINNNALKTYGGDLAIGAMASVNAIAMLCFMPVYGISQGAQPIIGYNFGAREYKRVENTFKMSTKISTIIFVVALILIQIFPEYIIGFFNKKEEIKTIAIHGIRIYLLAMPIIGIGMTGTNYFLAIGDGKTAMFLSLLRQIIFLIPSVLIFSKIFGLTGVWMAQPISDILSGTIIAVMVFKRLEKYREK